MVNARNQQAWWWAVGVLLSVVVGTAAQTPDPAAVAARVDGFEIRVGDVLRAMQQALGGRQPPASEQLPLLSQALDQLINRRLVELAVQSSGIAVTDQELAQSRQELVQKLVANNLTLEAFLAQQSLTADQLDAQLRWEAAWREYLQRELTDDRLEAVFDANRRQFDGTRLRASHVLLRIAPAGDPAAAQQTVQKALALRQQILAGTLSFAEAAEKYSDGPSRLAGGDLGWIPRYDLMVDPFSAALFALAEGEISPPVVTPFGIHLIQCTGTEPGQLTWQQARQRLIPLAAQQRFNELAATARPQAKIEYTGIIPAVGPR